MAEYSFTERSEAAKRLFQKAKDLVNFTEVPAEEEDSSWGTPYQLIPWTPLSSAPLSSVPLVHSVQPVIQIQCVM